MHMFRRKPKRPQRRYTKSIVHGMQYGVCALVRTDRPEWPAVSFWRIETMFKSTYRIAQSVQRSSPTQLTFRDTLHMYSPGCYSYSVFRWYRSIGYNQSALFELVLVWILQWDNSVEAAMYSFRPIYRLRKHFLPWNHKRIAPTTAAVERYLGAR